MHRKAIKTAAFISKTAVFLVAGADLNHQPPGCEMTHPCFAMLYIVRKVLILCGFTYDIVSYRDGVTHVISYQLLPNYSQIIYEQYAVSFTQGHYCNPILSDSKCIHIKGPGSIDICSQAPSRYSDFRAKIFNLFVGKPCIFYNFINRPIPFE